jgi:UDP-N-acetylmuramyl pentapeptide phosphotransferase/UDP-N-acetylglucosamine-1-phosphate transferase
LNNSFEIAGIYLPLWVQLSACIIVSFLLTFISIPIIVKVSVIKKLFYVPNERTSHSKTTPFLGGLSIFWGFTLTAIIFTLPADSGEIKYIIGAIIVLFFAGLKDDIVILHPVKKLFSQIIAASIVVIFGGIRITNFHHALGIENVSYIPSVLFSIFLIVTLINAYNFIDGIDGLAAGSAIFSTLIIGIWFMLGSHYTYTVLCFSLVSSLSAFFIYNVFGTKNKIFMGDTGAMIIGLIVAVFTIKFLEFENSSAPFLQFKAAPAVAFGLLIVPLFDTLRIIILRIIRGVSPFKADRNHLHHNLLKLGYSHLKITFLTVLLNMLFVFMVVAFQGLGSIILILLMLLFATFISAWLDLYLNWKGL